MNLLTTKNFNGVQLDCYQDDNDEDFWATREQIGSLLGYKNPKKAIKNIHLRYKERLDKFSKTVELRKLFNGAQFEPPFKNEPIVIVYSFRGLLEICRWSNQPNANKVMDFLWDVANDIRKHGIYISEKVRDKMQADPEAFAKILEKYFAEKEKNKILQEQIDRDLPYTTVGKIVLATNDSIPYTDGALYLAQYGFDIGRNKFLKLGRDVGFLCKQKNRWNQPSQKGIEKGVVNIEIDLTSGMKLRAETMLTPKGIKEMERILTELQRPLEALWNEETQLEEV